MKIFHGLMALSLLVPMFASAASVVPTVLCESDVQTGGLQVQRLAIVLETDDAGKKSSSVLFIVDESEVSKTKVVRLSSANGVRYDLEKNIFGVDEENFLMLFAPKKASSTTYPGVWGSYSADQLDGPSLLPNVSHFSCKKAPRNLDLKTLR